MNTQIITTNKAKCRDCYRCVRACPVKAIKMENGQASVDIEKCIFCGTCVKECPQKAKQIRNDVAKAKQFISSNRVTVVSIAPSFASLYEQWEVNRLPSALRLLGFDLITETAVGAYYVANESKEYFEKSDKGKIIGSSCPALVNYIEKYDSDNFKALIPKVSPMIAHAKHLRKSYGEDIGVIFIGPCVAKKYEAEREEYEGYIDIALTFQELRQWMAEEKVDLSECEESAFDESPQGFSRLFPITGGMMKTAHMDTDQITDSNLTASGYDEIVDCLNSPVNNGNKVLVEPLFCKFGCINGPGVDSSVNLFERKRRLLTQSNKIQTNDNKPKEFQIDLTTHFDRGKKVIEEEFSEQQIREVLEQTGKADKENQLNCGACGYPTCRDKAIAVLNGLAENEMCIPHMRRLAEQRSDRIIESSPNGIVILDEKFSIMHINPSFKKMFSCGMSVVGKHISYLVDPQPFEELASGKERIIETTVKHENYNLICHQKLYKLEEEKQYVGIFVDVTKNIADKEKLDSLKSETIEQAQELLDHQISMAQNLVKFLGESTAKGENLVENLLKLTEKEDANPQQRKGKWLWDMYTSK